MAQYLADLSKRGALAEHVGGQPVAELMGSRRRRIDSSALECATNDRSNGTRIQETTHRSSGS